MIVFATRSMYLMGLPLEEQDQRDEAIAAFRQGIELGHKRIHLFMGPPDAGERPPYRIRRLDGRL